MKQVKLMQGDNMKSLKKLPDNSIDSVVTDPPYGLSAPKNSGKTSKGGFMGKKWDYDVPSVDFWKEVYRVLKPGGHILSFGGTRTYHRMVVNIEDAGFEIRDQIQWIYGSGFPKSLNVGKAVDKLEGNEREVVGENPYNKLRGETKDGIWKKGEVTGFGGKSMIDKGTSPFEGWGTALKPANEPICLARKPLSEKSVAENVLKWKTGGINVDGCRVGSDIIKSPQQDTSGGIFRNISKSTGQIIENEGRFPANIILECICDEVIKGEKGEIIEHNGIGGIWSQSSGEPVGRTYNDKGDTHTNPMCPCRLLDEQSGESNSQKGLNKGRKNGVHNYGFKGEKEFEFGYNDKGGASRFFYQAKVSKAERNLGLDGFEDKKGGSMVANTLDVMKLGSASLKGENKEIQKTKNNHPTVKPVQLMAYLCRLITPEGGIVLDPFMGSGSTGIAAQLEGFRFVGMEMDEDYFKIAEARINNYEKYKKFLK